MKQEIYRRWVLAVACEIPGEVAYELLQQTFIDEFDRYYNRQKAETPPEECPNTLDALISFVIIRLPIMVGDKLDESVLYNLRSRRRVIVQSFLNHTVSDMVTRLASRRAIFDAIKSHLMHENRYAGMYSKINDSRVGTVFTQFLQVFQENSAHAFEFDGNFKNFVMFSFINYFFKGNNKDAWAMIREVDDAKYELEHNIVTERQISVSRNDDLKIHDLLVHINAANTLLFKHSGQTDEARGVMYDIYYLVLCELCSKAVDNINASLGREALVFIDPQDRRRRWLDYVPNKGVAAKVQNAKEIIPYIFSYVRRGALNVATIADLRSHVFELGKHDREGRNCVWEDVEVGSETSNYLDTEKARTNYDAFNTLLEGTISVYTLMTELENRGYFLVDEYREDLFKDRSLIRYIDYLSAVEHIGLIKGLQAQPVQQVDGGSAELYEYDEMVYQYAGSSENNHPDIREHRDYVDAHGFMERERPRLKQEVIPQTTFDKLTMVAEALNTVPHCITEYLMSLNPNSWAQYAFSTWINVPASVIGRGHFHALYYNMFMQSKPELARYYLIGNKNMKRAGLDLLPDLSWDVGRERYTGINLLGSTGFWLPIENKFFMYAVADELGMPPFVTSMRDIDALVRQTPGFKVSHIFGTLVPVGKLKPWIERANNAVGFAINIGIANIGSQDIMNTLPKANVLGTLSRYITKYYQWLHESSVIQHSIIEVLKTIYVESLYWTTLGMDAGVLPAYGEDALVSLQTGEFKPDMFNWFLEVLYKDDKVTSLYWDNKLKSVSSPMDKLVLHYCFDSITPTAGNMMYSEEYAKLVKKYETPAERFVAIYNHVCTKIEFLMMLRDAISLIVSTIPTESASLNCEFNSRFNVTDTVKNYSQSPITFGIKLWKQEADDIKSAITETRDLCMTDFRDLIDFFVGYVRTSEEEIANLVNYNLSAQSDIASRFTAWRETFSILPEYNNVLELSQLRKLASTDSAGFFLIDGMYFKSRMNSVTYYVHRSGRVLADSNGHLDALSFDFNKEKDRSLYRDILSKGFRYGREKNN